MSRAYFSPLQVAHAGKPITFLKGVSPFPTGMVTPWQNCMFSPFLSEWVCPLYIPCCHGFYPSLPVNSFSGGKAENFPVWVVVCKSIPNNAFFSLSMSNIINTSACFWMLYNQKQRIYYFVTYASHTVTYISILFLFSCCIVFCWWNQPILFLYSLNRYYWDWLFCVLSLWLAFHRTYLSVHIVLFHSFQKSCWVTAPTVPR